MKNFNKVLGMLFGVLLFFHAPTDMQAQSTVIQYQEDFRSESNFLSKVRKAGKDVSPQAEIEHYTPTEIFPNPAIDKKVTIKFDDIRERVVQVVEPTGEIIYQEIVQDNVLQLNLQGYSSGVYSLMITDTEYGQRSVKRLVIGTRKINY